MLACQCMVQEICTWQHWKPETVIQVDRARRKSHKRQEDQSVWPCGGLLVDASRQPVRWEKYHELPKSAHKSQVRTLSPLSFPLHSPHSAPSSLFFCHKGVSREQKGELSQTEQRDHPWQVWGVPLPLFRCKGENKAHWEWEHYSQAKSQASVFQFLWFGKSFTLFEPQFIPLKWD